MLSYLSFSIVLAHCLARESGGSLADAVHAIANKCHTRAEYDKCSNFATTEIANCSPGDINCQRAKIVSILDHCEEVCGRGDYMPFAVAHFLETGDYMMLAPRDTPVDAQQTFVIGDKVFTAADVIDALTLKQFVETRDRSVAPSRMIEDGLKPAFTNMRDSLQRPVNEPQLQSQVSTAESSARENLKPKHKRFDNGGGISKSFQIRLKNPQTGELLPVPQSYRYTGSIQNEGAFDAKFAGADDDLQRAPSDAEILEILKRPPWRYSEPAETEIVRASEELSHDPIESSKYETSTEKENTVILYQDVEPDIYTSQTANEKLSSQNNSAEGPHTATETKDGWSSKVKSLLNIHKVETSSTVNADHPSTINNPRVYTSNPSTSNAALSNSSPGSNITAPRTSLSQYPVRNVASLTPSIDVAALLCVVLYFI